MMGRGEKGGAVRPLLLLLLLLPPLLLLLLDGTHALKARASPSSPTARKPSREATVRTAPTLREDAGRGGARARYGLGIAPGQHNARRPSPSPLEPSVTLSRPDKAIGTASGGGTQRVVAVGGRRRREEGAQALRIALRK